MDKMNGLAKKIIIGVGILFAILIIAGIAGNKQLEEKAKTEPMTAENAAKACKDLIFAAKDGDPLYDYVPDSMATPNTQEIGETKDGQGFQTQFNGSYFDESGVFTCIVAGTKGEPKVYSITFAGRQIYGEADSWLKD